MRHASLIVLFGLLCGLGLPASALCAARPTPGPTLEQGLLDYRAGRLDAASEQLRGFVATAPPAAQLHEAWLTLARIALRRGDGEEALLYAGQIPTTEATPAVRLVQGRGLIATGKVAAGMDLLQQLAGQPLATPEREELLGALAEGQAHAGKTLQAVALYQQAAALATAPTAYDAWLAAAHALLRERLSDEELAEAAFMLAGTAVGSDALLQQAQRALTAGDQARATALAEQAAAAPGAFPYRDEALLLIERLTGKAWLKRSIGVVLPLSGRYGEFGSSVQRGMELALMEHNAKYPPVDLVFRDAGVEAETNARAISTLANEDRVVAIVGPLTSAAALAAAQRAQQERVPLLTLSQREGLVETGAYVFRHSLTARQQVVALLRHAMEVRGLRTFAVLAPENRLGNEMAELFVREVELRGGEIVGTQHYEESATDFRRQIKLLKGEDPNLPDVDDDKRNAGKDKGVKKDPEPPPFQAIFIPDDAKRVGLIAPQLAFYGVDGVQLLGTNAWNSSDLVKIGGRFVDGAVFVDGFFSDSKSPNVRNFVGNYLTRYHEDPSILEAQGYDAAGILLQLLDRPEVRSREGLRMALGQLRDYPGVTGLTAFSPARDAEKTLYLLQVRNGSIVQSN